MTYEQFNQEVYKLGLGITYYKDKIAIGKPNIANILLYFNPKQSPSEYTGGVTVKSINASLYGAEEIKRVLVLINKLLMTEIEERGEFINPFEKVNDCV